MLSFEPVEQNHHEGFPVLGDATLDSDTGGRSYGFSGPGPITEAALGVPGAGPDG